MFTVFERAVWCAKQQISIYLHAQRRGGPRREEVSFYLSVTGEDPVTAICLQGDFYAGCKKGPVLLQAVVQIINNLMF